MVEDPLTKPIDRDILLDMQNPYDYIEYDLFVHGSFRSNLHYVE